MDRRQLIVSASKTVLATAVGGVELASGPPSALAADRVSAAQAQAPPQAQAPRGSTTPNVVFILGDNIGYGDLGCYGGGELRGAPTPRLDQLAREGLRLTQYLVEPGCTPSRAALMTGRYSIREGLSLVIVPGTPSTLSGRAYTMSDMFHERGYATALFGKWHLGSEPQSLPTAHGFDECRSSVGHREYLLSFIGPELAAERWKQWRIYFTDMHATGEGTQRLAGTASADAAMGGYFKIYNIEMDPHEDLNVAGLFGWVADPALKGVSEYERSVKDHPNPPAPNITRFGRGG
jgi:arylsulfatase A-like enzyme